MYIELCGNTNNLNSRGLFNRKKFCFALRAKPKCKPMDFTFWRLIIVRVYCFSVQVLRVHFFGGLSYPPRGESGVGELSMRILQYLVNEKVKYL